MTIIPLRHGALRLLVRARYLLSPLHRAITARPIAVPVLSATAADGHVVHLRRHTDTDHGPWQRIRRSQRDHLAPWTDTDPRSWALRHTRRQWEARAVRIAAAHRRGDGLHLAITHDDRFVGEIALTSIDTRHSGAELGIWLDAESGGAGVASTAVRLLVNHAHDTVGLVRVSAPVAVDNAAARALFARTGFRHEGTHVAARHVGGRLVDHECWAHVRRRRRP